MLKLPTKKRIHNFFHILLLEQDIMKKKQVNKLLLDLELKTGIDKKYKVEII